VRHWTEIMYDLFFPDQGLGAIDVFDVRAGKAHRFVTLKDKSPYELEWSPDGQTLFTMYGQRGANFKRGQIGFISPTRGDIDPISRDTNRYSTLTLSADGRTLATVLTKRSANIYILAGNDSGEVKPLLSRANDIVAFNWTADGNLLVTDSGHLFASRASGETCFLLAIPVAPPASHAQLVEVYIHELDPKQEGAIAASRTPPWLLSGWGCRGRRLSRGIMVTVPYCLDSCRRTTSESECPRSIPSLFPSGDQWNNEICSDLKFVIRWPTEPSSGCTQMLSTPFSRIV
jgi:hypothetical protein